MQDALCELLRLGMYEEPALSAVGVAPSTYYRWKAEGEAASRLCLDSAERGEAPPVLTPLQRRQREMWEALCEATGGFEANYLRIVADAATGGGKAVEVTRTFNEVLVEMPDGSTEVERVLVGEVRREKELLPDWKAALEVLARRNPQRWARTGRMEMTGRDGAPLEHLVNVGDKAVSDPVVSAAVDRLLEECLRDAS